MAKTKKKQIKKVLKKTVTTKKSLKKEVTKKTKKNVTKKAEITPLKKQLQNIIKRKRAKKKGFLIADIKYFKNLILEKKKEVLNDIETQRETIIDPMTGEYRQGMSSYSVHMEHGSDAMEREKAFLLIAREARFLENLNSALERIKNKKYGWCKDCHNLIQKKRLEAVPHAQLCTECKNKRGGTPFEA